MSINNIVLSDAERRMLGQRFHASNTAVETAFQADREALNVTLFVGNGFDLGLGLNTGYKDFLRRYLNRDLKINNIVGKFVNLINRNKDTWGDAELAFGQLDFSSINANVEEAYRMCIHDFQQSLEEYLADEASRLIINKGQQVSIRDHLAHAVLDVITNAGIDYVFDDITGVNIDILTLNYTDTIDRLIGFGETTLRSRIYFKHKGSNIEVEFRDIVHLHGRIGQGRADSQVLFGVDNPGQVVDEDLRSLCKEEGYLVKPQKARIGNLSQYGEGKGIIGKSDVIVLFGVSYGKTDRSWWDCIANNVIEDVEGKRKRIADFHVILCPYTKSPIDARGIDDKIYVERNEKLRLFDGMSDFQSACIKNRAENRFHVLGYGPFVDPCSGTMCYCDPLHLQSIGKMFVNDYKGEPVVNLSYP